MKNFEDFENFVNNLNDALEGIELFKRLYYELDPYTVRNILLKKNNVKLLSAVEDFMGFDDSE